jgi:hypothetical protein
MLLPLEVIVNILSYLDINTLLDIRKINKLKRFTTSLIENKFNYIKAKYVTNHEFFFTDSDKIEYHYINNLSTFYHYIFIYKKENIYCLSDYRNQYDTFTIMSLENVIDYCEKYLRNNDD